MFIKREPEAKNPVKCICIYNIVLHTSPLAVHSP